ncbi:MAG: pyridoxamine 5'-phosphate oxidase family protein [Pseudomonadota bacterium]
MDHFGTLMFTPAVLARQERAGSRDSYARMRDRPPADGLGAAERAFIESRDSFYLASVSETGGPHVQHRGGPTGFLRVLAPDRIGFADDRGNRQYVTAGNPSGGDDRVALFLMDDPRKVRLKILGHARLQDAAPADLAAAVATPGQGRVKRIVEISVTAFDWNGPQFITPRYTKADIERMLGPRLAELQQENAALREALAEREG